MAIFLAFSQLMECTLSFLSLEQIVYKGFHFETNISPYNINPYHINPCHVLQNRGPSINTSTF